MDKSGKKGERRFYKPIGKWLVENERCRQDEYSIGYGEIGIAPGKDFTYYNGQGKVYTPLGNSKDNFLPDVLGIRYEVVAPQCPYIDFHAYIVEVKNDAQKESLREVLGKILMITENLNRKPYGFNTMSFYIAYPFEIVDEDFLSRCKKEGIGILRLEEIEGNINAYLMPNCKAEAKSNSPISHRAMRSPGVFEDTIKGYPHIMKIIPGIVELWNRYHYQLH